MLLDPFFILGEKDTGKSTLARSLSGKGQDIHKHPDPKNVHNLRWMTAGDHQSLVFIGSLNEKSPLNSQRGIMNGSYNHENVHSCDLIDLLQIYAKKSGITRAILCVSLSTAKKGWRAEDYVKLFNQPIIVAFPPKESTGKKHLSQIARTYHLLPSRPHPVNDIARDCRSYFNLT